MEVECWVEGDRVGDPRRKMSSSTATEGSLLLEGLSARTSNSMLVSVHASI